MNYEIKITTRFEKEIKKIAKKHKGIKSDIASLIDDLQINPVLGTDLGNYLYKIRIAISGTNKGKSGGARVITCVVSVLETIILAEIYLKSEADTVDIDLVVQRLQQDGLI